MRLRKVKNASEILNASPYVINSPEVYKGKWSEVFNNNHEIRIEIGMGKGTFVKEMALKYPDINFIGIEKYDSVLVTAVKRLIGTEIPNLRIICIDAAKLNDVFAHEINTIYLNFSDPWPKSRHHKRRLTSEVFLQVYDNLFANEKRIEQKTDNEQLFEYSISSLSSYHYQLSDISVNLHASEYNKDNVYTEYESKFALKNQRIYRLVATKRQNEK